MTFTSLLQEKKSPKEFLEDLKKQNLIEVDDYLYFANYNEEVLKLANVLASLETISKETLENWFETGFLFIGKTIDGDYLGAKDLTKTIILPRSFYLADIEEFAMPYSEFLSQLLKKQSLSNYIQ